MQRGYEEGKRISLAWDEMMTRHAVGLLNVARKTYDGTMGDYFSWTRHRDMFFTSRLNKVAHTEIFKCNNALQEDTPYIVMSSQKDPHHRWVCYPVKSVTLSNGGFIVQSKDPNLKRYIMNINEASCDNVQSQYADALQGSCDVLGMNQERWIPRIVDGILSGDDTDVFWENELNMQISHTQQQKQ